MPISVRFAGRSSILLGLPALALGSAVLCGTAQAGTFDLGWDTTLTYKAVVDYGVAIRMQNPSAALYNGPIDPLVVDQNQFQNGSAFAHTGLPHTANFDDGERNFKNHSLINNRLSLFSEAQFTHDNYGAVFSGDYFFDQTYHRPNDHDSPDTVNHFGQTNRFTPGARYYDGQRPRLLEAYGYADWNLFDGDVSLDVRAGKQLVAWGEALFFTGIALAQSPTDATKAFIPGAEVKDILLPVNQLALHVGLPGGASLMGYYHLDYKADEIFPVGDFYSVQDAVGPGAQFAYGSVNPAFANGCSGLFTSLAANLSGQPGLVNTINNTLGQVQPGLSLDSACNLNGVAGPLLGAGPYILSYHGADIKPSKWGQWGVGGKYPVTSKTELGLFFLRYADTTPAVQLNPGCAAFSTVVPLDTCSVNESVPVSYQQKYYDGVRLLGGTFSTSWGPFNFSGELNYRDKLDMPVKAMIDGEIEPVYTRGKLGQADLSSIFTTNPHFVFDEIPIVAEVAYIHVFGVDPLSEPAVNVAAVSQGQSGIHPFATVPNPIQPTGNGQDLFFSKNAWGYEMLAIPKNHNVFPGWDLSYPFSFSAIAKGNPSMAGAFGALFGEGDQRASVGLGATYLDNLEIGLSYNFFFGEAEKTIRGSDLHEHPYTDRDNATFSIKYEF
ncbi:MAG TPA: DUF1302 family protein [Nevskia sp.]|nr:DUF1302 family protein [Nevskia sp.]